MASRKIQLLRSTTVYNSRELAEASLSALFAQQANLADGEVALARYKTTDEQENETIKAVLGIYNSKSNLSGFTIIRDAEEASSLFEALEDRVSDLESEMNELDLSFNIDGQEDTNVPQESSDNSRIITSLAQENGQVYVGETSTKELLLTGYEKANTVGPITGNDTIETALNKLENNIEEVKPLIDETTIQMDENDVLFSGLRLIQVDSEDITDPNVREQYVLGYQVGQNDPVPVNGDTIKVYKDSSLKEVYLGTEYDTVDSETGEVRRITYIVKPNMESIDSSVYDNLSETEKALYSEGYHMCTLEEPITQEQWNNITIDEYRALYSMDESDTLYYIDEDKKVISDEEYNNLSVILKSVYSDLKYDIKTEYRYLTATEHNDVYQDQTDTVYIQYPIQIIGTLTKDILQSLNFVYHLEDGTYRMVKIDVSKFLTEYEFGDGLLVSDGTGFVKVNAGNGLAFGTGYSGKKPLIIKIDETSNPALSVGANGLKLDLTSITENALDEVEGGDAIEVSEKENNKQTINLILSETLTNSTDARYAGHTAGGEVFNNNILQIKEDGLYLDSTWDCGEY